MSNRTWATISYILAAYWFAFAGAIVFGYEPSVLTIWVMAVVLGAMMVTTARGLDS